jgi:large subunit ribosomal protein L21
VSLRSFGWIQINLVDCLSEAAFVRAEVKLMQTPLPPSRASRALKNQSLTLFLVFGVITLPSEDNVMYAVLETGGKQYRVSAGDTLEIERLAVEAGQPFTFDRVLLVNNDGRVTIGAPTVAEASIVVDVVEHRRGPKKIAFKMKRRKGYHKTIGHRQELTVVKIKEIKA